MTWYMRGGLTYDEAMALSFHEREIIGEIIKKNMETTEKSGLPFFWVYFKCFKTNFVSLLFSLALNNIF